jgi:phenylalanyl-tRNA synthetase beta subunit
MPVQRPRSPAQQRRGHLRVVDEVQPIEARPFLCQNLVRALSMTPIRPAILPSLYAWKKAASQNS